MSQQRTFDSLLGIRDIVDTFDGLRPYQTDAVETALNAIYSGQRMSIIKLPTGSGKTRTAIALVRRWLRAKPDDKALWLANRTFLTEDAIGRLYSSLGEYVGLEKAEHRAGDTRMTVGSLQTFVGKRLACMQRERYGLIIVDESQTFDGPSGLAVRDHFTRASFVGLSATPGDAVAFGGKQAEVYSREILWAIDEGYFVPIVPRYEKVVELDISDVKSVDGDLQVSALEKKVAECAVTIAKLAWKHCGTERTIIYTPGVASAHAVTRWLNEQRSGCAVAIDAKTPPKVRRQALIDFDAGVIQFLTNCGIFLYGLDVPKCRNIVIARPTEDSDLWKQMVGRGGRPAEGIGQLESIEQRLTAIASSSKPDMLLLVLSGEEGKHSLCDVGDLDETATPEQRKYAKKLAQEKEPNERLTVTDVLKDAKAWQAKENDHVLRAMERAKLKSVGGTFDPFAKGNKKQPRDPNAPRWQAEPATSGQRWWLRSQRLSEGITKGEASMWRGKYENWVKNGRRGDWKHERQVGEEG